MWIKMIWDVDGPQIHYRVAMNAEVFAVLLKILVFSVILKANPVMSAGSPFEEILRQMVKWCFIF